MAEKVGLRAAVAAVTDPDEQEQPEAAATDQMPLWPAHALEGRAPGDPAPGDPAVAKRGAGRPPGARNKSSEAWVEYLRSRYRSPLEMLAETFSRPVRALAEELNCSRLDAFKLQLLAAKELAPYMHSKMPQALQIDAKSAVHLSIDLGDGSAAPASVQAADYDLVIEGFGTEENQQVSDPPAGELDKGELDK